MIDDVIDRWLDRHDPRPAPTGPVLHLDASGRVDADALAAHLAQLEDRVAALVASRSHARRGTAVAAAVAVLAVGWRSSTDAAPVARLATVAVLDGAPSAPQVPPPKRVAVQATAVAARPVAAVAGPEVGDVLSFGGRVYAVSSRPSELGGAVAVAWPGTVDPGSRGRSVVLVPGDLGELTPGATVEVAGRGWTVVAVTSVPADGFGDLVVAAEVAEVALVEAVDVPVRRVVVLR